MKTLKHLIIPLVLILICASCSKEEKKWEPPTSWNQGAMDDEHFSWNGSYQNAIDSLEVKSHAWKIIGERKENEFEWGFRVIIEFAENPEYDGGYGVAIMPINLITYELLDEDGFHLDTLEIKGENHVEHRNVQTFQGTGLISLFDAKRAAAGKITIAAGYPKETKN